MSEKRVTVQKVGAVLRKAGFRKMQRTRSGQGLVGRDVTQEGYRIRQCSDGVLVEYQGYRVTSKSALEALQVRQDGTLEQYREAMTAAGLESVIEDSGLLVTGYKQEQAPNGEGERGGE